MTAGAKETLEGLKQETSLPHLPRHHGMGAMSISISFQLPHVSCGVSEIALARESKELAVVP